MDRRTFLAASAGVLLGACTGGEDRVPPGRGVVVVVGAGLAGLTAAYELDRAGWAVTILEARNRIGGRVLTLRDGFAGGQHAEAGGEFVDRVHSTLISYVHELGLELEDADAGEEGLEDGVYYDSRLMTQDAFLAADGRQPARDLDRFWERLAELGTEVADPQDPATGRHAADLDARSAGSELDGLDLHPRARFLAERYLEGEYTVEPASLSLLFLAQQAALYADVDDEDIEAFRIKGGADRLPKAFADRLGRTVRLGMPVTHVTHSRDQVSVRSGSTELTADYAVLTAPLPALRAITFEPQLPPALRAAVVGLGYGAVTKVLQQYTRRAWRTEGYTGTTTSSLPLGLTWEATNDQVGTEGILIAYTPAAQAEAFGQLDGGQRLAEIAAQLVEQFPSLASTEQHADTVAWKNEAYSGGSYAAFAPGQVTRYWNVLRNAHGRLYIAGEHVDAYAGYMEGALRSGRRAAAAIIRRGAS